MTTAAIHAGLCTGGPDWPYPELKGVSPERRVAFLEELGDAQATCIRHCGGDYLRMPFSLSTFLGPRLQRALSGGAEPPYSMSPAVLADALREADRELDRAYATIRKGEQDWSRVDAVLRGVERANADDGESEVQTRVLLCLVSMPPRPILEAPPQVSGQPSFGALWDRFIKVHILMIRALVSRYCGLGRCVSALEVINEPDYHWLPDEQRIERALRPDAFPLNKYLTELHLSQIPETADPCRPFHQVDGGHYVDQSLDLALVSRRQSPAPPVLEFPWGSKFEQYVAGAASLMEHVSFAAKQEAAKAGVDLRVVSGAVTHNNVDYLIRMYQVNNKVFRYVDSIGLHPYHWPRHDMHDMSFVAKESIGSWQQASPRRFAEDYFKRFDFLKVVADFTRQRDPEASFGMAGKTLWLTEFGIPTKKCGHANKALASYRNLFIYRREDDVPKLHALCWEDKWDAFLRQVTPKFLADNRVEALLMYTMRAAGMGESTDEEHSNFTLFEPDCRTARMHRSTFERLIGRFSQLTGRTTKPAFFCSLGAGQRGSMTQPG